MPPTVDIVRSYDSSRLSFTSLRPIITMCAPRRILLFPRSLPQSEGSLESSRESHSTGLRSGSYLQCFMMCPLRLSRRSLIGFEHLGQRTNRRSCTVSTCRWRSRLEMKPLLQSVREHWNGLAVSTRLRRTQSLAAADMLEHDTALYHNIPWCGP